MSDKRNPIDDLERWCREDPRFAYLYHRTLAIDNVYLQTCVFGYGLQSGLVQLPVLSQSSVNNSRR